MHSAFSLKVNEERFKHCRLCLNIAGNNFQRFFRNNFSVLSLEGEIGNFIPNFKNSPNSIIRKYKKNN